MSAKLPSVVIKIEEDLQYRMPSSGRALSSVILSREQAEQLLQEIYELRIRAGEKNADQS